MVSAATATLMGRPSGVTTCAEEKRFNAIELFVAIHFDSLHLTESHLCFDPLVCLDSHVGSNLCRIESNLVDGGRRVRVTNEKLSKDCVTGWQIALAYELVVGLIDDDGPAIETDAHKLSKHRRCSRLVECCFGATRWCLQHQGRRRCTCRQGERD